MLNALELFEAPSECYDWKGARAFKNVWNNFYAANVIINRAQYIEMMMQKYNSEKKSKMSEKRRKSVRIAKERERERMSNVSHFAIFNYHTMHSIQENIKEWKLVASLEFLHVNDSYEIVRGVIVTVKREIDVAHVSHVLCVCSLCIVQYK